MNFFFPTRYNDEKKGEKLQELQVNKCLSESQLQSCYTRKQEISTELDKRKELKRNQDQLKRNIEDNLNYRKTKAEVEELSHEIESLEDRILKLGGKSKIEAEFGKLSQERERLLSEVFIVLHISFFVSLLLKAWLVNFR